MKRKENIFKILIALTLILTFLTSCGQKNQDTDENPVSQGQASGAQNPVVTNLTAKKLFEFKDYKITSLYEDSLEYGQKDANGDKRYGVRSYSGKDTGLKYDYAVKSSNVNKMYVVSTQNSSFDTSLEVAATNVFGIVDGKDAREIVPCIYADFESINSRYIKAYKVKAKVQENLEGKVEGDFIFKEPSIGGDGYSISTSGYSLRPGSAAYSFEETIIDLQTGLTVDKSKVEGSDSSKMFDDGSYVIKTTERDTVYNADGKELFSYNPNEYQLYDYDSGYYIAKRVVNGESKFFVLDNTGTKLSAEFDDIPMFKGSFIWLNKTLYKFDGTPVINDTFDSIEYEKLSKDLWILNKGDNYKFINGNGETLLNVEVKNKGFLDVNQYQGLAYEKSKDGAYKYFNFEKKDYSITGYYAHYETNLLVSVSDGDSRYDLIDVTNGNMLCEGYSGYEDSDCFDGFCYIAAERTEGGYDIYKIQNKVDAVKNSLADDALISENQLNKIYEIKEDLFTELEKALNAAGLKASVDRDNGEIAFDAAVVFARDSSEISEEGKKLLDSFVKAYGSVLNNEKYKGFISKTIVEGHTAPLATSTYESGLPLSQERAGKVKDYCKSIDSELGDSFEAVGYSNSMPIYNLDGTVNQDASRRVTFKCIINNEF